MIQYVPPLRTHLSYAYPNLDEVIAVLSDGNLMTEAKPSESYSVRISENTIWDGETDVCLASWPRLSYDEAAEKLETADLILKDQERRYEIRLSRSIRRMIWHCAMGNTKVLACEEIARQIIQDHHGCWFEQVEWWHDAIGGRNPEYAYHHGSIEMAQRYNVSLGSLGRHRIQLVDNTAGMRFK